MKVYPRHPFYTNENVRIIKGCGPDHPGAKDLVVNNIIWTIWFWHNHTNVPGTPVFAMESGTVEDVRWYGAPFNCQTSAQWCLVLSNRIMVKGSDGYYTEYAHVMPYREISKGKAIQTGELLGFVDGSGYTTAPHVHIARFTPGDLATYSQRPTCDWSIQGVVG